MKLQLFALIYCLTDMKYLLFKNRDLGEEKH